jgi:hypothetical protein
MQVMILMEATEVKPLQAKNKAIDEAIERIKQQSPEKFFHYGKDKNKDKPDPAMSNRVFYDEPYSLAIAKGDYAEHKVPFSGSKQSEIFKARSKL